MFLVLQEGVCGGEDLSLHSFPLFFFSLGYEKHLQIQPIIVHVLVEKLPWVVRLKEMEKKY